MGTKGKPKLRTGLVAVASLLLGFLLAQVQHFAVRPELVIGQDAISTPASTTAQVTLEQVGGPVIHIQPAADPARLLLVFYPGGLVRPQAYEWLGRALTAYGVETVIPAFPLDLAVTQSDRAGSLIDHYAQGCPVVLAGHSLGGAMAAQYASKHPDDISGLILLGAYPPEQVNLSTAPFPALSLLAEHDGVAAEADVRAGMTRLPAGSRLQAISGSVHSFFGRYGPQKGDGLPTVSRQQAETQIMQEVAIFLEQVR